MKFVCAFLAVVSLSFASLAQVGGSGTPNTIAIWTATKTLGNSALQQSNGNVGIGTSTPASKLEVVTSSASGQAILARNMSKSTTTFPLGIVGLSNGLQGIGLYGTVTSTSGAAVGTMGVTVSSLGVGVEGVNNSASGSEGASGISGFFNGSSGTGNGVTGSTLAPSGAGVAGTSILSTGVSGTTNGTTATAGYFDNTAAGNILIGAVNGVHKFRVDGNGKGFFDGGTQTGGADFAESVAVVAHDQREPGDLLVVDASARRQLKLASEPYSTLVAGIYSTKPGVLATPHSMSETVANEIPLAIVGIVPCKVSAENGAIAPGDLLVTSTTPGHAMKGTDRSRMLGAVVGKALEPLSDGKGVIQVLVTLQ